ncbi:DUF4190 domain-containing protein [Clostridium boliviensis]|uniref:DUF4190 domain-containing protein n=1 Tax=Clostridium boliviensis TaxID=318465 RepID=A0ABU4GS33_9CLOT|nr:DUF4190 domain-containing protein [Clostridium boliviensis]MDW2799002.1 DUF4190 domain-containing protein [Clostridium boliviensis]
MDQDNQMDFNEPSVSPENDIQPVSVNSDIEQNNAVNFQQPPQKMQNNMALASLIMGIIGIVTACSCYGGLIFGSLGIVFALLSKTEDHFEGNATAGLITSIIALVLTVIVMFLYVTWGVMHKLSTGGAFH